MTAGNAPGLNDGASAVVLASRRAAEEMGARPLAKVVGYTQAAVPPKELFIAPARALPRLADQSDRSSRESYLHPEHRGYYPGQL